ncbi:MAG TPA: S8 family serine peptidase, partial [Gammaproteobacteria bacterium]|nr:S8 family serine peptidase [Gammaproteobacteria bacterium]
MRLLQSFAVLCFCCLTAGGTAWSSTSPVRNPQALAAGTASGDYIVRFKDQPVPLYTGSIAGLAATNPHVLSKQGLRVSASRIAAYAGYLKARHNDFLTAADATLKRRLKPRFEYRYALNGMSLRLSKQEAAEISRLPGVVAVEPVRVLHPLAAPIPATAASTGASRTLVGTPEVWSIPTFDTGAGEDTEGEGIVVADLDTGINAGNSSFAATGADGYTIQNPLGHGVYLGVCDPANTEQAARKPVSFQCNDKLIGTYTFVDTSDTASPDDSAGHGSHTASTAAGDFTETTLNGATIPLSGIAPHANVIAYDVCNYFCNTDQIVAAVNQAISDYNRLAGSPAFKGMVMNFSIGGSAESYDTPTADAFLAATEAGIYVSAAAGNGGPVNGNETDSAYLTSVENQEPWIASVAATTYGGIYKNSVVLSGTASPGTLTGTGVTAPLAPSRIVYAGDYQYPPAYPYSDHLDPSGLNAPATAPATPAEAAEAARECAFPFPPGTFATGDIVVCDRSGIAPTQTASNVAWDWSARPDSVYSSGTAGGAGLVLVNAAGQTDLGNDYFPIPGVRLSHADGETLENWLASNPGSGGAGSPTNPANAALSASIAGASAAIDPASADYVASFSSRYPSDSEADNYIKPDFAAPGVDVLAAWGNPKYTGAGADQPETFAPDSGTSMATPHGTGVGGLLMQLHPSWTPAEIKSALMLTAVTASLKDQCADFDGNGHCVAGTSVPAPHVRGSGRIDVGLASRTGLIMDETADHYRAADPAHGGDPSTLNLPGLANNH